MIKGQGTLEMLIGLGGIIIVAFIVITMVIGGLLQDTGDTANDNLFAFIDAIETNESNMLENSSFEIDTTPADGVPDFWIIPHPSNFYLSNEESRRGSYSIKLISTPGNLLGNPYGKEMHQEVTLAKGTYRIYAYIMQKAGERFANNDPYFDVYCEDCGAGDHELCDAFLPAEKDNIRSPVTYIQRKFVQPAQALSDQGGPNTAPGISCFQHQLSSL